MVDNFVDDVDNDEKEIPPVELENADEVDDEETEDAEEVENKEDDE